MMNTTQVLRALLVGAALCTLPVAAAGQDKCASGVELVGSIGISLLDCDCVIGKPFSGTEWKFNTAPRIARIAPNSPASGQLQAGDIIRSVGDVSITTPAGAQLLAVVKPGQPISITVDRNGETLRRVLTAEAVCADSPDVPGVLAPTMSARASLERTVAQGAASSRAEVTAARADAERVAAQGGRAATTVQSARAEQERVTAARAAGVTSTRVAQGGRAEQERAVVAGRAATTVQGTAARREAELAAAVTSARAAVVQRASAWIGLGFSCTDCSLVPDDDGARWTFRTPPTVYSVEVGSPAYGGQGVAGMRRGDVLTHVDGMDITTTAGGRRLGSVKPGESLKLRYRRPVQGGNPVTREITIVAGPSRAPSAATVSTLNRAVVALTERDATAAQTLRAYEATRQQEVEQQRVLRELVARASTGTDEEKRQVETLLSQYVQRNEELERKQVELVRDLVSTQRADQAQLEASRRALTQLTTATASGGAAEQRLRYSGTFAGSDIEVRGLSNVIVTERGDEIIITTGDATIRLKKTIR